ncbi:MAG: enoyl-CoA hydratase/isomerase family protein [Hyphomonadaceae bacterium]|nr:enoyl-CoA hydratase/isomerase family protein [Hyphomonadaceae bacterium]
MTQRFADCVRIDRDGAVATVTLDRGDGRNALSLKAMQALIDAAAALKADTEIQAVILTSAGAFTAGADLKDPDRAAIADKTRLEQRQSLKLGPDMCAAWESLEQITIAAIERYCIGGGVALAVACDHRIVAEDAFFRLPEIPLGMNMSWQTNPRTVALIGPSRAKQFTILGERCSAATALEWGLADQVVPVGEARQAAEALAARYAKVPPIALRMTKQAINVAANPLGHATSFMDRDQFAFASTTNDQREAIQAFLEKRDPAFKGD